MVPREPTLKKIFGKRNILKQHGKLIVSFLTVQTGEERTFNFPRFYFCNFYTDIPFKQRSLYHIYDMVPSLFSFFHSCARYLKSNTLALHIYDIFTYIGKYGLFFYRKEDILKSRCVFSILIKKAMKILSKHNVQRGYAFLHQTL